MNTRQFYVTIIVCTRNRPTVLKTCLKSLIVQKTDFPFDILCVENDSEPKMQELITELQKEAEMMNVPLRYLIQPIQNIGLTRNYGIENSSSSFLAFIDDDEYAAEDWLQQLVNVQKQTNADVVTGMVHYKFPAEFPEYVRRSRVYDLYKSQNEPMIHPQGGADANTTLYRRELFILRKPPFNPEYGRTGGGDYEFALFLLCNGKSIFKTTLAIVYENQPINRAMWKWHIERQFREPGNTLRAIRTHCGRIPALKFIIKRFFNGITGILQNLPELFIHPCSATLNLIGCLAVIAGTFAAMTGFRKTGYF